MLAAMLMMNPGLMSQTLRPMPVPGDRSVVDRIGSTLQMLRASQLQSMLSPGGNMPAAFVRFDLIVQVPYRIPIRRLLQ